MHLRNWLSAEPSASHVPRLTSVCWSPDSCLYLWPFFAHRFQEMLWYYFSLPRSHSDTYLLTDEPILGKLQSTHFIPTCPHTSVIAISWLLASRKTTWPSSYTVDRTLKSGYSSRSSATNFQFSTWLIWMRRKWFNHVASQIWLAWIGSNYDSESVPLSAESSATGLVSVSWRRLTSHPRSFFSSN